MALIGKATESYEKEIAAVRTEWEKAYEYDLGRPLNKITVTQWAILLEPERNLVGGFLKIWKSKDSVGATFVTEK